ncbi:ubinuclein-2 isoform X2 [Agrilus planipennis]|uniref:Ubinuclein-2 isoform X2 n=1 Tax=Agrilus planipennis TaxID=224129 RepID=A0A1W4WR65_AGRPL|nr:ubinuclein-2 isoform X2 [Agrilus planipennis]
MSDFRRESLISLGTKSANNDKSQPVKRSVRISVTLPESTEDGYPQINFRQELAAWEEKHISSCTEKSQNGLDPFNDDDDDDVRRVAQELEAKYGISSKKKRRKRKKDIAIGYDESDSFIDNTDCYDEIIPKNITTLHGGFYINSGALEFERIGGVSSDESSSSSEEEEVPEKPKKRPLASSSDSETDEKQKNENKEKKQKMSNGNANGIQKALKNKLFSDDKIKKVRKNSTDDDKKKAVRDLLKEKRDDTNVSLSSSETPKASTGEVEVASLTNIATVIESVVNASNGNTIQVIDDSSRESTGSKENQKTDMALILDGDSNDAFPQKQEEIVKLPDNIPNDILTLIHEIKHAAAQSTEGKVKFFSGPVSTILLSLERKCRTLKKSTRVRIYEHLAPFVRCRKETLIKRAKNLILEDDQKKIKHLLNQLHSEVQEVMPSLLHSYEIESQKVLQKRYSKEGLEGEDLKSLRMPKRRFTWTEETKKLLREIVTVQKKCFLMEGRNKDKLDELITSFLKSHVQVLWPEGWISMNSLLKYSNSEVKKQKSMTISNITNIKNISISDADVSRESTGNSSFASKVLPPITSKSSSLTITPIMPADVQKNAEDQIAKAKASLPSDIIISNVNSNSYSIKANKPLPMPIEITKTMPDQSILNRHTPPSQEKDEFQLIQQAMAEDLSQKVNSTMKTPVSNISISQNKNFKDTFSSDRDLIMDLTESVELKRKPGPKSKTKYYVEDPERPVKIKKATSDKMKAGNKDGCFSNKESEQYPQVSFSSKDNRSNYGMKSHESVTTGSYALDKLISDSLADAKCFASLDSFSTLQKNSAECTTINLGSASTVTFPVKPRHSEDGDENQIQEVLEGLRALQKMSSPAKVDDYGRTSAPASVITYNSKSSSSLSSPSIGGVGGTSSQKSDASKKHVSVFHDEFQRQFIKFNERKTNQPAPAPNSKNDFNSVSNSSYSSLQTNIKTPNNNYAQPYYNKLFNNINNQQGSYNMLQDMFANLLKESGYKTGDKSNVQQK